MHEAQMHSSTSFLTLTYSNENLPKDFSVNVKHWQDFAKRLRKEKGPFRFFHCGEYGDVRGRPHYHAILFGLDFSADRKLHKIHKGNSLYISDDLDRIWGLGHTYIGSVTYQSAAYVARYSLKKRNGDQAKEHYEYTDESTGEVFDRKPEYVSMSLKPGIGATWYDKYKTDVYPHDYVVHDGKKLRPPKYYDRLFEEEDAAQMRSIKQKRVIAARERGDGTAERLATLEEISKIRNAAFMRDFD